MNPLRTPTCDNEALGQCIIPEIQECPQLDSIYVFSDNQSIYEQCTKTIPKVKGAHTGIELIGEVLQINRERCDRAMISISYYGIDPLFRYTQLLKETFLEIEDDDIKSIKELVDYCRLQGDLAESHIDKVEQEYRHQTSIWWDTAPYFIYSMLNRGLRVMDVDIMLKIFFFIRHLHEHIKTLHRDQQSANTIPFQVFRDQGLSLENFEKMKKAKGGLMSFDNFLSTSRNCNVSLEIFARPVALNNDPNLVGILFVMNIDPSLCATSSILLVDVKNVAYFEGTEEEILFSTHTIFRIDRIERIHGDHTDRLWQINLTLVGNDNHDLSTLTAHIRQEFDGTTGWSRLGHVLRNVGEFAKAEQLYQIFLGKASSDTDKAYCRHQLSWFYNDLGEYSKALKYYEKALDIDQKALPPNHPDLASDHNNIGSVYDAMGEYLKALLSYERSLEIKKISLSPNHPALDIETWASTRKHFHITKKPKKSGKCHCRHCIRVLII
ncbi:unnamed protein product [Rotaria sp. Silwood2]|nr:unnamed protein product [Rotaria sp. Silwood2]CAF3342406.1 unnamed protein product [Rotaria sp. Silwood2]